MFNLAEGHVDNSSDVRDKQWSQRHRARLRFFILLLLSTIPVGGSRPEGGNSLAKLGVVPLVDDESLTVIRFAQVAAVPLLL
jgi:hypothetical protein